MTYIELVNKVLVRLREDPVENFNTGTMGPLISALVQDAYRIVEDAHDWSVLREDVTVPTVASQDYIELTDTPVDSMIYDAYIAGTTILRKQSKEWLMRRKVYGGVNTARPDYYVISGANATTGDLKVELYPTPDDVYNVTFQTYKRGTSPTVVSDVIRLPTDPILHLSLAFATRERGETGGTSAAEYFQMADLSLGQAIARDANHRPDEITLYAP